MDGASFAHVRNASFTYLRKESDMYDYILFDLDGTLTDPKEGITKCVQYALKSFGIDVEDLDELKPFIGPPLKESFMEFYDFDEEKAQKAVEKYRERFQDTGIFENRIYNGVPEMIRKLKGNHKKIAVASSKPTVFVERILEHFEIRKYFDVVVGSELDGTRTDKAEVLEEALRQLYGEETSDIQQKKSRTAMVGDRKFDVAGAKAQGVVSVAVSYGYGPMDELKISKPDYIVRTVEELEKLLLRGTEKTVGEPPMSKIWFVLFPMLVYYLVRSMGSYIGLFILGYLSENLPKSAAEKLVFWDEAGALAGVTGNGSALIATVAFLAAGIVTWKFFAKEELGKVKKELALKHARLKSPLAYGCMAVSTIGFALGLNFLFELLGITKLSQSYADVAQTQYAAAVPVGLLLNGLLVPVVEEMIFRGVIYNRLKKYVSYRYAILFSAIAFGVYHQNIVQGSYALLMGCLIAWFYERFGHFYVAVLVHALSNLSAYLLTLCYAKAGVQVGWIPCIILLVAGIAGLLYCMNCKVPNTETEL